MSPLIAARYQIMVMCMVFSTLMNKYSKPIPTPVTNLRPAQETCEKCHWPVSQDVKIRYLAADRKLTRIAGVRVERSDGSKEEFKREGFSQEEDYELQWRIMDCLDCHNRPTHVFQMPKDIVDFGLLSRKLNPEVPGIYEDSLIALQGLRGETQKFKKDIKVAAGATEQRKQEIQLPAGVQPGPLFCPPMGLKSLRIHHIVALDFNFLIYYL